MSEPLAWPPEMEDLERMYLVEMLSAAKIAKCYGLDKKYKSPKVAESTILYQLGRFGIKRRDRAEHAKKVTTEIAQAWAERYLAGESLKQISGDEYSPVTVMLHLQRQGLRRRDKVEAQIKATTLHQKAPFIGDDKERAYLFGFARGDLHVSSHGRAVRLKTSTTHPHMIELCTTLFSPYGHVAVSPRHSALAGYEWDFQVDLDSTFSFLIVSKREIPAWIFRTETFPYFAAGFFDAEGSIWLNKSREYGFEAAFTNKDENLLERISEEMRHFGIRFHLRRNRNTSVWSLSLWRLEEIDRLLTLLPLRHPEKVQKAQVVLKRSTDYEEEWEKLIQKIKAGRDEFVQRAKREIEGREKSAGC